MGGHPGWIGWPRRNGWERVTVHQFSDRDTLFLQRGLRTGGDLSQICDSVSDLRMIQPCMRPCRTRGLVLFKVSQG